MTYGPPAVVGLTRKGWYAAQPDRHLLRAPCISCGVVVNVRRSGVYGVFGRRHRCPVAAAA